jgi:two-component system, NarL family, response regulator NreC
MAKIRIVLADDHKIIRDGLRALIEKEKGMEVVDEASDGREAVKLAWETRPEIVIMDVNMPDLNGIEATRQITSKFPEIKVIALSMHSDRRFVAEMLKAGASGYLLKDCAFDELIHAINVVRSRKVYLSPGVSGIVVADYVEKLGSSENIAANVLSDREREVLQLITEGVSTKEIAEKLFLSAKTVETHRRQIMSKLNLFTVAELTKYAIREGLTSIEN